MNLNVETAEKMDFVRDFLFNVCEFNSDICNSLITRFCRIDRNIFSSIYLNNNEKYQVLVEFIDKGININSKVTTSYQYNDGIEWIKEDYIDQRKDRFVIEVDRLHHIYNIKNIVSFCQEHSALREGMKELKGECFYLLTDNFSLEETRISKLQKTKNKY